jgi:mannitol 2-dehydrogenase
MAKFLVPSLTDLLAAAQSPRILPLVIASWLLYLRGRDENGRAMTVSDPLLGCLKPFLDSGGGDARLALFTRSIFGELASTYPQLVMKVQGYLDQLRSQGVRAAIAQTLEQVHA